MVRKSTFFLCLSTSIVTFSFFVFTSACHKSALTDNGYAAEQANTEKTFSDVESIADQASTVSSGSHLAYRTTVTTSLGCATVTKSSDSIIINFGPGDCMCLDGRTRRGKIIVTYSGNYMDSGSTHTITFDNYYQNDNKVTGTKTVINTGHNAAGQPTCSVSVNGSVTLAAGGTISAIWTRTRTWTNGYNTPLDFSDDVYSISGSGTLVRANGGHVAVDIPVSTPLIMAAGCKYIEAGTITFTFSNSLTRSLNYGNSPICDDKAELTTPNGTIYNIVLP